MRNSAGPDDAPDAAPDQHVRPRHVAPLRTANDRTGRLGLERPPTTAEFHINPLTGSPERDARSAADLVEVGTRTRLADERDDRLQELDRRLEGGGSVRKRAS
jgi:hypothetical protein